MELHRRDFLKKSGLVALSGFIPTGFSAIGKSQRSMLPINTSFLIRDAEILSMDNSIGDLPKGSILIEQGKISRISETIEVPEGIEVIEGSNAIVMPGLIDCHWHLWTSLLRSMAGDTKEYGYFPVTERYSKYYTPADMKIAARYAAAEALYSGITTLTDYNHNARTPEFVLAGCEALAETGIRARVEYNGYRDKPAGEPTDFNGIETVLQELQENDKYKLLSLGLGSRGAGYENLKSDWEKARALGMKISIHASSNKDQIGQIGLLQEKGLLGKDVNIIHGNAITRGEIEMVAKAGTSITMTPYTEMRIGYGLPRPNELLAAGINTSLGVDSTALSGNADLFSVMKLIQNLANAKAESEFYISPHQVLEMATIKAAKTLGIENITGSLSPGKQADIIMVRKNNINFSSGNRPKHLIVEATSLDNVDFVAVNGKILKQDGVLTNVDINSIITHAEASFQRLTRQVERNH